MSDTADVAGVVAALCASAPSHWWAAPAATILATGAAGTFAFFQIRTNRQMARLRASLDLIERTESQQFYQDMRKGFTAAAKKNFTPLLENERVGTLYTLNHFEIIAIGCYAGVLDKTFYKNWMRTAFVRDWKIAQPFILTLRNPPDKPENPKLYVAFERLAKEWEK